MPNINGETILFFIASTITTIQIFYYLFFFSRLAFYNKKSKRQSQQHPVSVVVCARDEAANLARNLPGVLVQQYRTTFETIVVNDNSQDDSKYVLEEFQKIFKSLKLINLTQEAKLIAGKKYPLSIGIKEAVHELLLLTDADCVPASENWIEKMQDGYNPKTEIVLGYGGYNKRRGFLNKVIRFETFHTAMQYLSYALAGLPYMGVGRNLSYKKNLFLTNKGFSATNHIPGGDDDLFINKVAHKHNTAIVIDKESFTYSMPKKTWRAWVRQKTRHFSTAKYYKPIHKFLLGLYGFCQIMFFITVIALGILFNWQVALLLFAIRLVIQLIVYYRVMKKLDEADLWPLIPLLDLVMLLMNLFFIPALIRKAQNNWSR